MGAATTPRSTVRRGTAGRPQVKGRNSIPVGGRPRLDEEYVRNRSASLDVRIMLKTIRTVLFERGD
nr:MAG: hypothetical protein DIU67_08785 [Actinomycetota bacterium]